MALLSNTEICINGKALHHFKKFSLHQELAAHHNLNLYCQLSNIQAFCKHLNEDIEDLLGQVITIEISASNKTDYYGELKFKGVIIGLKIKKGLQASEGDFLIIKAQSPTILAEDGPHYTSFNEMTFTNIIDETFNNYDSSKLTVDTKNSKLNRDSITYTVQYNESCFNFAKRLAARNGEWMYYNGETLKFGINDNNEEELTLFQGRDLLEFSTAIGPIPHNYNFYTNDYTTSEIHISKTKNISNANAGILGAINESADELFPNETRIWLNQSDDNNAKSRLDNNVNIQNSAIQSKQIRISGLCDNPGIAIGRLIKINQNNYRVIKVTHNCSNHGQYENVFEAIVAGNNIYPLTNVLEYPKAESQTALVKENHDPDGMGRVKVQFPWQEEQGLLSPWIRSISPSASNGQGFFFIPELGDEVLVDFEGGNAESPYVIGGVYNAKSKPPSASSNSSNHIKMLQTRSGCVIILDDNAGSIKLQDAAGSLILLDGEGNIVINAVEQLNIDSKAGFFNGSETVNIGSPDTTVAGDSSLWLTSDAELKADGANAVVEAKSGKAELKGVVVEVNAATNAKINATAITEIKGAQVKLN
ncbi:MAG: type VI secretion system Vgr family protein [Oceanihabitans sp.]